MNYEVYSYVLGGIAFVTVMTLLVGLYISSVKEERELDELIRRREAEKDPGRVA